MTRGKRTKPKKKPAAPQSAGEAVKALCDLMRRSGCDGAMKFVPELTWILFLRFLDDHETREAQEAEEQGKAFVPALTPPWRWRDWAAPESPLRQDKDANVWKFVHGKDGLLATLRALKDQPGASPQQRIVSEIVRDVETGGIDPEENFLEVLDIVNGLGRDTVAGAPVFTLSQVFDELLLKLGEKRSDGGLHFTPREVIRVMVRVVDPQIGKTVYDPACGTGGFLVEACEHMRAGVGEAITSADLDALRHRTFHGQEKDGTIYPVALANLVLHGIDEPHLWHADALSKAAAYEGLFAGVPGSFDYVLMNPPCGGKESKEAQAPYQYQTGASQVLFIQNVLQSMKAGSRCGLVLDEGVLSRIDVEAFVQTRQKLLGECDVFCIVSLPAGLIASAGAAVNTNLVFFEKGRSTGRIWYFDLSDIEVGKKSPLSPAHFEEFFRLLPERAESPRSWTVEVAALTPACDLKPVNPTRGTIDERKAAELLALLDEQGRAVDTALARMKALLDSSGSDDT